MASRLIGLSGYAQSGKDTTAQILIDEFGFTRVSFADALRDALYVLDPIIYQNVARDRRIQGIVDDIGWDEAKTTFPEIRSLLQRLGTEVGRNILGDDVWVDIAMRKVHAIDGPVVITDLRFPNEYDSVVRQEGELWRIVRPGTEPINNHPSETALDNHFFDKTIANDGTVEDLRSEVVLNLES